MPENHGGAVFGPVTSTGAGGRIRMNGDKMTFMAAGETSADAGAATISVEVTNIDAPDHDATSGDDAGYWIEAGEIELTLGTTITADGFAISAPWKWARFHVTAISGTDAAVTCYVGTYS